MITMTSILKESFWWVASIVGYFYAFIRKLNKIDEAGDISKIEKLRLIQRIINKIKK